MATVLISNPGSASRKYALFVGEELRLRFHFEYENGQIVCMLTRGGHQEKRAVVLDGLAQAAGQLPMLLREFEAPTPDAIALRIVAPSSYFLQHRRLDGEALDHLRAQQSRAPLHIEASLNEFTRLTNAWPDVPVFGISDSAFHATKPDYAWNYGIRLEDADRFEIKRFGYHGLSAQSAVRQLADHVPGKLVVCHLGSGSSIMALRQGVSVETTMGFSPLEGLVMSTRSGTIDPVAAKALQDALHLDDQAMLRYLHHDAGLLGLSGIGRDIRELLEQEQAGNYRAGLALRTYVHRAAQAIGGMAAVLGGVDALVFTGAVGERAAIMRRRIIAQLHYLEFELDYDKNNLPFNADVFNIHRSGYRPVYVVPAKEEYEMALAAISLLG